MELREHPFSEGFFNRLEVYLQEPGKAEIAGMSGSPVVIEGTSSVVGLVVRVHQVWQGSRVANIIMFVGPDEIRDLGDQK
jgi:hypothetical protein